MMLIQSSWSGGAVRHSGTTAPTPPGGPPCHHRPRHASRRQPPRYALKAVRTLEPDVSQSPSRRGVPASPAPPCPHECPLSNPLWAHYSCSPLETNNGPLCANRVRTTPSLLRSKNRTWLNFNHLNFSSNNRWTHDYRSLSVAFGFHAIILTEFVENTCNICFTK
jgi:hypothetical protein